MFYYLMYILAFIPIKLLFPTIIKGRKNLLKGKAIYVCNHTSNFDVLVLLITYGRRIKILAKKELFKNKFFGWLLKYCGAIPVDRQNVDLQSVKTSLEVLKNNKTLLIFPTATRKEDTADVENLKKGTANFALRTDAPIVPMMFSKKVKLFSFNKLTIGEPIYMENFADRKKEKETIQELTDLISKKMAELI